MLKEKHKMMLTGTINEGVAIESAIDKLISWLLPEGAFERFKEASTPVSDQEKILMKTPQGTETFLSMTMTKLTVSMLLTQKELDPSSLTYETLIDNGLPAKNLIDGWGTPFRFRVEDSVVRVSSAGPDRTFNTEDDLAR